MRCYSCHVNGVFSSSINRSPISFKQTTEVTLQTDEFFHLANVLLFDTMKPRVVLVLALTLKQPSLIFSDTLHHVRRISYTEPAT